MKYKVNINLNNVNDSRTQMINLIEENKKVLDVGCACGDMGEYLFKNKNCILSGIEYDIQAIDFARQRNVYDSLFQLDLNNINDLKLALESFKKSFDYIVCGDILEHLYDPLSITENLKEFLADDGHMVISLPNIAHGSVKLSLLEDDFTYNELGLLDKTHIRFFTRKTILDFLLKARLEIIQTNHVFMPFETKLESIKVSNFPMEIIELVAQDQNSFIYQYVIKSKKSSLDAEALNQLNSERMIISGRELMGLESAKKRTFDIYTCSNINSLSGK